MKNYVYIVGLYDYEDHTCIKAFIKLQDAVDYIVTTYNIDTKLSYKMNKNYTSYPKSNSEIKLGHRIYLGCSIQKVELG